MKESQTEQRPLETLVRGELFSQLVDADIYAPTAPITRYAESRFDVLCGDELERPEVFVVKDESITAWALPGVVVISDGVFRFLKFQEELDAVFAHETTHNERDHMQKNFEHGRGEIGKLGIRRTEELEADLLGMRLMDRRGINPAGMISLSDKLGVLETEETHVAPSHWKSRDRKINLEQSLWLLDARHLSDTLTPLQITPDEYGNVYEDTASTEDSLLLQQRSLFRAARAASEPDEDLLARQCQLLQHEQVSAVETDLQACLILAKANPVFATHPDLKPTSLQDIDRLKELLQKDNIDQVAGDVFELDVSHMFSYFVKEKIVQAAEKSHLDLDDQNDLLDIVDYAETKDMRDALIDVTYEFLHKSPLSTSTIQALASMIAHSDIPRDRFLGFRAANLLNEAISQKRLELGLYLSADVVSSLVHAARYSHQESRKQDEQPTLNDDQEVDNAFLAEYEVWHLQERLLIDESLEDLEKELDDLRADKTKTADDYVETGQEHNDEDYEAQDGETRDAYFAAAEAALQARDEEHREEHESDFVKTLELQVTAVEPQALTATLIDSSQSDGGPSIDQVKDAAELAIGVYRTFGRKHEELLELYVLCGRTGAVRALLEQSALTATQKELGLNPDTTVEDLCDYNLSGAAEASPEEEYQDEGKPTFSTQIQKAHKSFTAQLRNIAQLNKRLQQISPELGVDITSDTLDSCDLVKDLMLVHSLTRLARKSADPSDLVSLMQTFHPSRIRGGGLFLIPEFSEGANNLWGKATERLLSRPDLLENEKTLLGLAALGLVSPDLEINLHIPAQAFARIAESRDFEGALQLVSQEFVHLPVSVLRAALDIVIEEKAQTGEDFARINEVADVLARRLLYEQQEVIGGASLIDTYVIDHYKSMREKERHVGSKTDIIRGLESTRLMRALLMTGHDDGELKRYLAERWWLTYRTHPNQELQDKFRVEDLAFKRHRGKENQLAWWILHDKPAPGTYHPLGEALDHLYLSTSAARYVTVRNLLLGENGILEDDQGRKSLIAGLMESWIAIEAGSGDALVFENLLFNILAENPDDRVYQYISPVLQEMILHTPQEPSSTEDIARGIAQEALSHMEVRGIISQPTGRDLEALTQKVVNLMKGSASNHEEDYALRDRLLGLFGETDEQLEFEQISPAELALLVGKRSGALGTRMLQLAGQYFEIPQAYRERYAEVYDNMKGQTRLQAFNLLEREARYAPEIADLLSEVERFEGRLGGGSLVTVYGVTLRDGSREVLGVRNPNAEFHVRRIADMLQNGLDKTVEAHQDEPNLQLAQSLLVDAVEWIRDELNDTTFEAKDSLFRAENDTRGTEANFSKGRSGYDLKVPYTKPTGSLWVRREEYIPGENLNRLTISDEAPTDINSGVIARDDYKDAISLLVRNYMHQMMRGSVAHSDIHPGNFRITPDNKELVVFDRYNLIPITDELRNTLQDTLQSLVSGQPERALDSILSFSLGSSPETVITPELQGELREVLASPENPPPGSDATDGKAKAQRRTRTRAAQSDPAQYSRSRQSVTKSRLY